MLDIVKALLVPGLAGSAVRQHPPSDLMAFEESRARLHKNAKRLTAAVKEDEIGKMIGRMKPPRKRNGR